MDKAHRRNCRKNRRNPKIVHQLDLAELKDFAIEEIFNPTPKSFRPKKRTKEVDSCSEIGPVGYSKIQKDNDARLEIVNVIPLMYDETLFDFSRSFEEI